MVKKARNNFSHNYLIKLTFLLGFVPSAFVYPAENILQNQDSLTTPSTSIPTATVINSNPVNANGNAGTNGNYLNFNTAVISQPHHQVQQHLPQSVLQQQQLPQQFTPATSNVLTLSQNNNNFQPCQSLQPQQQQPAVVQSDLGSQDDLRFHGTELVMLYDYKAQAPDDLSARRGEIIYADLNNQTVEGWLWAYAPKASKKCGKYGFIPKSYTHTYNRQNTSV